MHDISVIAFAIFSPFFMVLVLGEQNCKSHGAFQQMSTLKMRRVESNVLKDPKVRANALNTNRNQ